MKKRKNIGLRVPSNSMEKVKKTLLLFIILLCPFLEIKCDNNPKDDFHKSGNILSKQITDSAKEEAVKLNGKALMLMQMSTNSATDSAILYLNKALSLDSTNKAFYANLNSIYFGLKEYDLVKGLCYRYLKLQLNPHYKAFGEFELGMAYYCNGEKDSAFAAWNNYDRIFLKLVKDSDNFNDETQRIPVLVFLGKDKEASSLIARLEKQYPEARDGINAYLPLSKMYSLLPCNK